MKILQNFVAFSEYMNFTSAEETKAGNLSLSKRKLVKCLDPRSAHCYLMKKNEHLENANVISQKVPEMLKSSFYLSIPKDQPSAFFFYMFFSNSGKIVGLF